MGWTYHQSTGEITHNGTRMGFGYAGSGKWRNVPQAQHVLRDGPLPQGMYSIASHFVDDSAAGKHSLQLIPNRHNNMFGRSRFLIHGDNPGHPGDSSDGGIVTLHHIRLLMLHSGDKTLTVVS
jgi:hypothetical protein